uniref:Insulin-like domain-containing protein n=1 Tax=Ascaris lumbricoides TaxID=6252 RepID=A0A0M3HXC4_ASCLU
MNVPKMIIIFDRFGRNCSGARAFTGIANQCCEEGCTVLDMRATCCFKLSCLRRCYPNSGYGRRIKGEETVKIV